MHQVTEQILVSFAILQFSSEQIMFGHTLLTNEKYHLFSYTVIPPLIPKIEGDKI